MSIGGYDVVLIAPTRECIGDLILRACRRHWPSDPCLFQDALDEVNVYDFDNPWVWTCGSASKEFFVYPNQRAVQAWKGGPTSKNVNTMLYFIVGNPKSPDSDSVEVAVVFDRLTKGIERFLEDLNASFVAADFGRRAA